jgi:glycosyltransferase involved in cell wall biosynthesis
VDLEAQGWGQLPSVVLRHGNARKRGIQSLWHANIDFARWARQDRVDVFWSPRHHLPRVLSKRIAAVVTIHDLVWRRYPRSMPRANRLLEWLSMGSSLRRAAQVIAVSEFTRTELGHFYPAVESKVSVVHEAARILGQPRAPVVEQPYFLFVGTLEARKNLHCLLEAYAGFVSDTACPHQLVLIGARGWGLPSLQEKCESLGIAGRVHFPGFVADDELAGYYQLATALVLPSLYEGFGLPVVEAMHFGTPSIVSDRAALPEVAGDAALLVDPDSSDDLRSALAVMATDVSRRAELVERCAQRSGMFSWERAAAETLRLLREAKRN